MKAAAQLVSLKCQKNKAVEVEEMKRQKRKRREREQRNDRDKLFIEEEKSKDIDNYEAMGLNSPTTYRNGISFWYTQDENGKITITS